ncbi:four helix bundle protein [Polaribacter sp.]|uniref:four helix bundle protein n=1 Tax=Polaribacter sp. TaxID=1920175 RepID=UPI003F6C72BB
MSYKTYSFEKLDVYQAARKFKIEIKKMSSQFPKHERFDLISQINRASASISANLAEGSGRSSNFDQAHFTNISYASGLEIIDHLNTALDLSYIKDDKYKALRIQLDGILSKLNALYKYQLKNTNTLKKKLN